MKIITLVALVLLSGTTCLQAETLQLSGMGVGGMSVPVTSLKQARFKAILRQQYDFSCGSAALATLLTHHYGRATSEQEVFEEMYTLGDQEKIRVQGFSMLDMKNYLKKRGLEADGFELPLTSLASAGLPAIVLVSDKGYQHFVVVKGLKDGRILLGDPAGGARTLSVDAFMAIWVNKVLFVIHNQREQARFNQYADWQYQPAAPLAKGISLEGLGYLGVTKFGPADF